jgi:hypothetical protein
MQETIKCKICGNECNPIFKSKILNKYEVDYFRCRECNFVQFKEVFWFDEAYKNSISDDDTGYVTRNIVDCEIVSILIKLVYNQKKSIFLDYGGGYGLFTRLMRDKGFNFFNHDKYSINIFAKYFEYKDLNKNNQFNLITSFEVFEHLINPLSEISLMLSHTDSILFSTMLIPKKVTTLKDWWYFEPENGQHISFYTKKTLKVISERVNCRLYTNNNNLHLLTKRRFIINPIFFIDLVTMIRNILLGKHFNNRRTLINSDYNHIKKMQHK